MLNLIKNRFLKIISLLIISVIFFGCDQNSFDEKEAMLAYLKNESNGYIKSKKINEVNFELMYKPTDLFVNQELEDDFSKSDVDSLKKKYNGYLYFNLSISKKNREILSKAPKNRNEFSILSNQLMFEMREKVYAFTQDMDTINMVDYIYPRMYGASHSTNLLFIYPQDDKFKNSKSLNFVIKELGLGTGDIKFQFETKKIKAQPELLFKKLNK